MSTPYLGEIRIFSISYAPAGWAQCNGQLLPINQNTALFSVLGTTYGGNGTTTFALPNMQGRLPLHFGKGIVQGQNGGEAAHTLIIPEIPLHTHGVNGSTSNASAGSPAGNLWAEGNGAYNASASTAMNPAGLAGTGGNQPHENRSPYLTVNFCIATEGIFPSPN